VSEVVSDAAQTFPQAVSEHEAIGGGEGKPPEVHGCRLDITAFDAAHEVID
jgi:hypothetical protein